MFAGTDFRDLALWQKPPNLDQRLWLWQKGNEKVEIHEGMTKKPPQTMSRTLNLWQSKAWSFHILINSQHLSIAQGSSCLWHDEEDWPMGRQESLRTSTTLTKAPLAPERPADGWSLYILYHENLAEMNVPLKFKDIIWYYTIFTILGTCHVSSVSYCWIPAHCCFSQKLPLIWARCWNSGNSESALCCDGSFCQVNHSRCFHSCWCRSSESNL
jgi:hypothetical protein